MEINYSRLMSEERRAEQDKAFLQSEDIDALHDLYCRTRSEGFGAEIKVCVDPCLKIQSD